MNGFDLHLRTRVVFGNGAFERLGDLSRELGFANTLVVADSGMVAMGLADRAVPMGRADVQGLQSDCDWRRLGRRERGDRLATGVVADATAVVARLVDALAAAGKGDFDYAAIGTMVKQQRVP